MKPAEVNEGPEQVDLVVVGGGPSGSQAALLCAESGMNALMIDSKMEIGSPDVCADAVNMDLEGLGDLRSDDRITLRRIDGVTLGGPLGKSSVFMSASGKTGDAFNHMVARDRLDKELSSMALLAGARIMIRSEYVGMSETGEGYTVTIKKEGRLHEIRTQYVIMAGGAQYTNTRLQEIANSRKYVVSYSRGMDRSITGVRWSALGSGSIRMLAARTNGQFIRKTITGAGFAMLPDEVIPTSPHVSIVSGESALTLPDKPILGNGKTLFTGSLAGLYDPLFITGFREAVLSGRMAASCVIESEKRSIDPLNEYTRMVEQRLVSEMSYGKTLASRLESATPGSIEKFLEYLAEFDYREISAREIFRRTSIRGSDLDEFFPDPKV